MKVIVLVKASKDSEAGVMPSPELLAEMGKFNQELVEAGIMLAGEGLHPSSKGKRVRFSGDQRTVIDGPFAETKELEAMGKFNEDLVKAGIMLAGEGLQASSKGKRVRFEGSKKTVIDGPFAETKELVAGFWLWQVKSLDEAVEWLKRAPFKNDEVEIRQVFEAADFAPVDPTGEIRKKEEELRKSVEARQS